MTGSFWGLLTILGPLLLGAALAFALLRNRRSTQGEVDRTERATHDLYQSIDRSDKRNEDPNG